jgi:glucose/arabinose dehydrogenase
MRLPTTLRRVAAATSILALLAACGGDDDAATGPEGAAGQGGPATTDPLPEVDDVAVQLTTVAELEAPIAMAIRPGHDPIFVAERAGFVRAVVDGDVAEEPVLDINDETTPEFEQGLLGLAFSPDGDFLYVSYTDPEGDSHIDEFAFGEEATAIDLGSRRTLLDIAQPYVNHNGGHLAFGPDGHLYFGAGDGGGAGDPEDHGQNTSTILGSLLRIDPRPDGDEPYGIPDDNPFADGEGGAPEAYAYGLRNPWRFSFDRETGDLWIADVGQSDIEEINHVPAGEGAGANFGWRRMEGTQTFGGAEAPPEDHWAPVYEYANDGERCSVTGGYVYRGSAIPALTGSYLYGDFCESEVRVLEVEDGEVTGSGLLGVSVNQGTLVSFGEDAEGELYVLSFEGTLSRIDPA